MPSLEEFKEKLHQKWLEFEQQGLESYKAYLEKEHANSANKSFKKAYHDYIDKELKNTINKLQKIKDTIG